jgi:hypothetical protein
LCGVVTLLTLAGCSSKAPAPPTATRPSLESSSPDERIDAAKDAAKKFGVPK